MKFIHDHCSGCTYFDAKNKPAGSAPDAGLCRFNPPRPISAYGAEYPVIRTCTPACSHWQPAPAAARQIEDPGTPALGVAAFDTAVQTTTIPDTDPEEQFPHDEREAAHAARDERLQEFMLDHDMVSLVDGSLVCGMHPKRTNNSKTKPRIDCDTCIAIWDFNQGGIG